LDTSTGDVRCERSIISGFQSRKGHRQPHPFGEKISQAGRVEGDPRLRLPATTPPRVLPRGGFFTRVLRLRRENEATAAIAPPSRKKHKVWKNHEVELKG